MPHIWVKYGAGNPGAADTEAHAEPLKPPRCFIGVNVHTGEEARYCFFEDVAEERIEEACRGAVECIRLEEERPAGS
jgi:hypothetical protein